MPRPVTRKIPFSLSSNNVLTGITVPNSSSLNPTAAVALEIFFKPVFGQSMTLFDNSQVGVTNSYYAFVDGTGSLYWYSTIGGIPTNIIGISTKSKLGEWNMAHWIYNGSAVIICLNGVQIFSTPASGSLGTNNGPLRIGAYWSGGVVQTAKFTQPRIYSRVFTLQDHKDRYFLNRDDSAMRTGLVLDMPFSEGTGTNVADVSGLGNNGTFSAPVWSTDVPFAPRRQVTNIPGSIVVNNSAANAAVSGANIGITPNGSYSFGGWYNLAGPNSPHVLCSIESSPSHPNIAINIDGTMNVTAPYTSGAVFTLSNIIVPYGTFFHVTSVLDATTGRSTTYLNGKLVDTRLGTLLSYTVQKFHIGNHGGGGLPMIGIASESFCYGRALTAVEVDAIYRSRVFPSSALGIYSMSDSSGSTVTDSSGNANNATIVTPVWSTSSPSKSRSLVSIARMPISTPRSLVP